MFHCSAPLVTTPERALERARIAFASCGISVQRTGDATLDLRGPGMLSTHQSSLTAITRGTLAASSGTLALDADLGGLRFMQRFILLFPPALILLLAIILHFAGPRIPLIHPAIWINLLIWIVLGPLWARMMGGAVRRDITAALKTFAGE